MNDLPVRNRPRIEYRPTEKNREFIRLVADTKGISMNTAVDLLVSLAAESFPEDISDVDIETRFILNREDHVKAQQDHWLEDGV